MRFLLIGALASSVVGSLATVKPIQHWTALNRITLSATGDLTLRGGRLSFSDDGSISVRLVKSHARGRWSETNTTQVGDIYKVDPPAKPSSACGDVLCDKPATYIVLSHPVPSDLDLSVYTSAIPPKGDGPDATCAIFSYTAN